MTEQEFQKLIKDYQEGRLSSEERHLVDQWMDEVARSGPSREWTDEELFTLRQSVMDQTAPAHPAHTTSRNLKIWVSVVAAASVLLIAYLTLHNWKSGASTTELSLAAESILPSAEQVTITLENGEVLTLDPSESEVYLQNGGISYGGQHHSTSEIKKATLQTPKGKQVSIILSDGTKVWLNAGSKLSYPLTFGSGDRIVSLQGEGYFEVAPQFITDSKGQKQRLPFVVQSAEQKIEVLGTKFNIKNYDNDGSVKTSLLTGVINVVTNSGKNLLVKPDQEVVLNKSSQNLSVRTADARESINWLDNMFSFQNANLQEIMNEIQRWYDIEVVVDKWPSDRFYGQVKRTESLSEVINMIEATSNLRFKVVQIDNQRKLVLL